MNKYESIFLIKGRIGQEKAEKEFEEITKEYNKKVEIIEAEFKGKRQLAYSIKRNKYGYFCVLDFNKINNKKPTEIDNILKEHDNVLKFVTIKMED